MNTVADVVVERLTAWGVDRVFGYSGDGIDPVLGALRRAGKPAFVQAASTPEQVPMLLDRAFRAAVATRSPTCVILPHDVQAADAPDPHAQEHRVLVTSPGLRPARVLPRDEDLREAAALLTAGERVAIMVGQGAYGAAPEIRELAERLGAGVTASLLGKPVLDENLRYHTGVMGHLGTTASERLLRDCDTLLLIGTNDPWTEFYPRPGQARAVQIDIDGRRLGVRYPVEVPLLGDAAETVRKLLDLVPSPVAEKPWAGRVREWTARWHAIAESHAQAAAEPVNPQLVVRSLNPRLPAGARVARPTCGANGPTRDSTTQGCPRRIDEVPMRCDS